MKISKDILETVKNLIFVIIFMSGWILFLGYSISRDKEEARILNDASKAMRDSITHIGETSQEPNSIQMLENRYIEYINNLIEENKSLTDSLYYYKVFYRLTVEHVDKDYVFEKKKSKMDFNIAGS